MTKYELKQILENPFENEGWTRVLRDIFGVRNLLQTPKPITLPANDLAKKAVELGSFNTADGRVVGLYQIDLKNNVRIGQNRVGVRSLLRSVYKYDVDAALVVFVQNDKWRLSLISEIRVRNPETDEVIEQKTEPKRFTYLLGNGETVRTAVDSLDFYSQSDLKLDALLKAFSVEKLNKDFFTDYEAVFRLIEEEVKQSIPDTKANDKVAAEKRRLFTQRLFNRLMFIYFLQKKAWLEFDGDTDYLRRLFNEAEANGENFFADRLFWVFFSGLGEAESADVHDSNLLKGRRGKVPYLNGGLFEKDEDGFDERGSVSLGNENLGRILTLFERYNFTVDESSPIDVQVAVDPEMLGKVFEELVTGRGDSGSYYTPREIVQFMCREALIRYLEIADIGMAKLRALVYHYSDENLTVAEARALLQRLTEIRVVDPACGSGAYLLGILQELTILTGILDTRAQNADKEIFDRKLAIIQANLYGVDKDKFAVQIARLRLWLSLAIDFTGDEPQPLPNLDFKIECGDSLTAPDPSRANLDGVAEQIEQYRRAKAKFFDASIRAPHDKEYREGLLEEVNRLHDEISFWVHANQNAGVPEDAFDWAIEFAEVFKRNETGQRGFDVVLANPPYGAKVADNVRDLYFDRAREGSQSKDTYGLFMARGLQLLRSGGILSYIVSDTWRTIKSHLPLRRRILEQSTVHHFLDLPPWVFDATVNTCILTLTKQPPTEDNNVLAGDLRNLPVRNWRMLEDNLRVVSAHGFDAQTLDYARYTYPQRAITTYSNLSFFIASPELHQLFCNEDFTQLARMAQVKQGLITADNQHYLRKREGVRGSYEILDERKLLRETEIANLSQDEKRNGVDPNEYEGRHFLPYDKGGESNAGDGWLPNYYVPTGYFIDWSRSSVHRLETHTSDNQDGRIAARFQNRDYYFRQGITFSPTGVYSPTFRLGCNAIFGNKGSTIFSNEKPATLLLAILASVLSRYQLKNYLSHTVETGEEVLLNLMLPEMSPEDENQLETLVQSIIDSQKLDPLYSYYLHEQREIDSLIFGLYELTPDQVREVEMWFCRRYPRPAEAQGLTAEIKEKYADHLARCERILSKPPEYWLSNPILTLIAEGESSQLEFKETLEANNVTGEKHPGVLLGNLKTIAAFLNTDGGTLLIGVSDSGEIKGLGLDFRLCGKANVDGFELKLQDLIKDRLKAPVGKIKVRFETLPEGDVCRIDVEPNPAVTFLDGKDVYVRTGNRTEKLEGPRLAEWIQTRNAN
ncbi:MAG: putative DNA binding domain-containing protein [Acidobacteriota bacterium]|nr:MAG: putative DNA binding domain-containing protein [Acidobacteriota bacterium]